MREDTVQNALAAYSTDRVCDAPQHTTTQHNSAQHELALCDRCHTAWASGAHGWVPAGHPRYTRADYGQEAMGGSTSRARTRIRTRHAVRTPTVLNTVTGGDQRAWWRNTGAGHPNVARHLYMKAYPQQVHKFILMPQVMKIPAAKEAVDKEWEKLENFGVELDQSQK